MRKLKAILVSFCATVILGLVLAISLHSYAVDAIYKNVEDIVDGEMPPTVTSFQSGPDVVSTIGGSGEGLNCSLPAMTNVLFDGSTDSNGKRHLVLQRFRQACVFHDLCYRHGLATYGYNQNDCDRVLQNEAFRLCLYIRNGGAEHNAERCQMDSKKVLAGVSIGGAEAYRAWDRSTYFEFASDPSRSTEFSVARVVDHPFKAINPTKYSGESDQIILSFVNVKSNLSVACLTCEDLTVQQSTDFQGGASDELKSVGIQTIPQTLFNHKITLATTYPVWLPPRRRHAAPHLLVDGTGKNNLIWMSRVNSENTMSCVVSTDAARLLTSTLPQFDYCRTGAAMGLTMVEVDMYATSPLPMEILDAPSGARIFATGITAQKGKRHDLSFCSRSATRRIRREIAGDDQASCQQLGDTRISAGNGLGAFQNFSIVRPGQQLIFARDIAKTPAPFLKHIWEHVRGDTYSSNGALAVIDVAAPTTETGAATAAVKRMVPFTIDDRFDPMMPITRSRDDLRFLSLRAADTKVHLHLIDFVQDNPAIQDLSLTMNGVNFDLDRSWASRPMLILETKGPRPKTKLMFSRGKIIPPEEPVLPNRDVETLRLETLILERDQNAAVEKPFTVTGGSTCKVTYRFKPNPDFPCMRAFDPDRPMRSSPAAKMQASQLLVGYFAGRDGHSIAFPDACLKHSPIVLQPKKGTPSELVPTVHISGKPTESQREVACDRIDAVEYLAGPIAN